MIPVKHMGARLLREERDLAEGIGQAPAPATALVPNPVLFMTIGSCSCHELRVQGSHELGVQGRSPVLRLRAQIATITN